MYVRQHLILGLIASINLYVFVPKITFLQASIFFLSCVLIDVDHYLFYILTKKNFSLLNAYNWFINLGKKHHNLTRKQRKRLLVPLCFLHSIEAILIISILAIKFPLLFFVVYGFLFHLFLDYIHLIFYGYGLHKVCFIYEFLRLKNNKDPTRTKGLL